MRLRPLHFLCLLDNLGKPCIEGLVDLLDYLFPEAKPGAISARPIRTKHRRKPRVGATQRVGKGKRGQAAKKSKYIKG